ncbi:MAG: hypothetical protein ACOC5G_01420 [Acidobacteriota bacterium]
MNTSKKLVPAPYGCKYYRKILKALKESFDANYVVSEIPQIFSQIMRPKFIIRHDIHHSLKKGLKLARIEKEYSIRSSFMINILSPHYNLKEKENLSMVKEITDLGHEIGVYIHHNSLEITNPDKINIKEDEIILQCSHLETITNKRIRSLSFPKEFNNLPENSFFISQKVSASSKTLMEGALSDEKDFKEPKILLTTLKNPKKKILQVLIHPELWDDE